MLLNSFDAVCSPSHQAIAHEQVELLERAFQRLPDHYREVLTLSRILGLSQTEIAAEMDRTVPSVRNLLNRALVRLAAVMSELQAG
ncbi:MAG: RNA polymerase sigma factor [Planctomycetota bacterium]